MIIGIDPGKDTGIAYLNEDGTIDELRTVDFWETVNIITWLHPKEIEVAIELPSNKHVLPCRRGVDVGSVIREAELLVKLLELRKIKHKTYPPLGKISAEEFNLETGWKGKSNQHTRDAARLAIKYFNENK